ncbi:Uncharacterised protein [Achromobacter xylosoxidans]|uniref:hypothetical protein n=1 Tax=Achromobacter TaxID=222 RepID=UPI0006C09251|nr:MULTISPECIES: hypothetical protein [Achromobacter]CAB3730873.1 hypothetical protein LMG1866_04629 [Achromobacter ruhlandii]CAB3920250.1 hypothetical protein LMG26846_05543 [Achromobacter insuavis]CUJ32319.1 Uncharacterised protein [Achromobacter xylosoxidans]CUJ40789.1 Uncharacterised protein [Achromobacter sp. 2789STDY5608621]
MIFLIALLFLAILHLYTTVHSLARGQWGWALAHMLAGSALAYGSLWGMLTRMNLISVQLDSTNWSVWGFLAGGILTLLLAAVRLVHLPAKVPGQLTAARPAWTAALIAGVYMCFVVGDHLWFFRSPEKSAVSYVSALQLTGKIDISCPYDLVLADLASEPARYRCPSLVLFGVPMGKPLAPWPTYSSGDSEQLRTALARLGMAVN